MKTIYSPDITLNMTSDEVDCILYNSYIPPGDSSVTWIKRMWNICLYRNNCEKPRKDLIKYPYCIIKCTNKIVIFYMSYTKCNNFINVIFNNIFSKIKSGIII